jgi:hypothetical protein
LTRQILGEMSYTCKHCAISVQVGTSDPSKCAGNNRGYDDCVGSYHYICCNDFYDLLENLESVGFVPNDYGDEFFEKACPHCKVRRASWGCVTTRKKYETGLQYQSVGIFGSTCTRCGKGKKDQYQHSDGKNYCAPASANAGQAPASSANAAAGSPVNQKCCVVT